LRNPSTIVKTTVTKRAINNHNANLRKAAAQSINAVSDTGNL